MMHSISLLHTSHVESAEELLHGPDDFDLPLSRELLSVIREARHEVEAELMTFSDRLDSAIG